MATRKTPSQKARGAALAAQAGGEAAERVEKPAPAEAEAAAPEPAPEPAPEAAAPAPAHSPRFHFFIIDTGWKSVSAKVIRDNFHMIREFQNSDPLYVLTREQSVALVRANPDLIGKDPLIIVHDLHAKGGRGESGYHGFRLCLGLIRNSNKALEAMQEFLRFIHAHRRSADIEKDIKKRLHRAGLEGTIQVIREGAGELME